VKSTTIENGIKRALATAKNPHLLHFGVVDQNNNVTIPITVLEELDKFKVGNDTKNFSAREVIRFIDKLSGNGSLQEWISLGKGLGKFKIVMDHTPVNINAEQVYAYGKNDHKMNQIERIEKEFVYGIKPKNAEQAFAFHALLNDDVKLVALQGVAGTGKTLLALAAALEQHKQYNQIILARPIVPLSNREIGFLPGDANDKIGPYMEPLWDNMKFIKSQFRENEKKNRAIQEMQDSGKIIITPLAFIRGRSLSNIMFIVDEAQNLTPHEVKTIITRAGENTKIIFTGDVHQIDSPYLDENSNGLAYLIDRLKNQTLFTNVKLEKGERSELANLANELL
jgi:PhoH-like ATPase